MKGAVLFLRQGYVLRAGDADVGPCACGSGEFQYIHEDEDKHEAPLSLRPPAFPSLRNEPHPLMSWPEKGRFW